MWFSMSSSPIHSRLSSNGNQVYQVVVLAAAENICWQICSRIQAQLKFEVPHLLWFPHPDILNRYCLIFGTAREPPKICIHPRPRLMNFYNLINFQTTTACRFLVNGRSILTLDNISCGANEVNTNHPCRSIILGFARFKTAAWLGARGIIARVSRCAGSLPSSAKQ